MTEILLFHHAQGQTRGFLAFADELRAAGHVVHAPDLYDGKTFTDLDEGVGYAQEVGFETIQSAVDSPPMSCRTSSSMPDSRSEGCPRSCWPRRARAPRGHCCFTLLSRPPSSAAPGRRESPSRST